MPLFVADDKTRIFVLNFIYHSIIPTTRVCIDVNDISRTLVCWQSLATMIKMHCECIHAACMAHRRRDSLRRRI